MATSTTRLGLSREAVIISARTAIGTVISLLLARALKLREFYWAPISTIVILLSTIDPLTLAWQRFAGTAIGAYLGALIALYPRPNWDHLRCGDFHMWNPQCSIAAGDRLSLCGDRADNCAAGRA